jgi:acetoin utilization protein AcuB
MTVDEIMSTEVATAGMDDTLEEIRDVFDLNHYHHMPIIDNDRLVGIVSDRDVLRNLSPHVDSIWANNHDMITLRRRAHQIMTRDVVTISPEETIDAAAAIMLENGFSSLPVLDPSGAIVGIVTKTDLLESLCGKRSATRK